MSNKEAINNWPEKPAEGIDLLTEVKEKLTELPNGEKAKLIAAVSLAKKRLNEQIKAEEDAKALSQIEEIKKRLEIKLAAKQESPIAEEKAPEKPDDKKWDKPVVKSQPSRLSRVFGAFMGHRNSGG